MVNRLKRFTAGLVDAPPEVEHRGWKAALYNGSSSGCSTDCHDASSGRSAGT